MYATQRQTLVIRGGMGVCTDFPLAKYLLGLSNESCHSGRKKKKSGSMSAIVAVGGIGGSEYVSQCIMPGASEQIYTSKFIQIISLNMNDNWCIAITIFVDM